MDEIVIRTGTDLANDVDGLLADCREVFMVYDANAGGCAEKIQAVLSARGNLVSSCSIVTSEENKSIATVLQLVDWMLRYDAGRDALLLAVGGGITTDMAGFAASVYKGGIRFAFVPTTLLSQVDAAIGGKTGVNFEDYKNMIGVIRQPEFTYINPRVLDTLPYRDFVSGSAEMLKTFIISGGEDYSKAVEVLSGIFMSGSREEAVETAGPSLQELVMAAARIKAGIAGRDQYEGGERRKLNLGHTFGHAVEWEARRKKLDITHGEAVAVGMVQAARLACAIEPDSQEFYASLRRDLTGCGLPVDFPFPLDSLGEAMRKDKKAEGGKVHFVLPFGVGDVRIVDMSVDDAIDKLEGR